jgi:nucleoside-diphosphate-sugar epimerase
MSRSGPGAARFSVLGAGGYIGSQLVGSLRAAGHEVAALGRNDDALSADLGHAIYCVAVTNDARERPWDSVRANVLLLLELLERSRFSSFLYLSSAQLYLGADRTDEEAPLVVHPQRPDDTYRLSKAMGELVCRTAERPGVRVARLSAVYGDRPSPRSFLASVVREAVDRGRVELRTSLDSERDFIHLRDVARVLPEIALRGQQRAYNVASGRNTSNAAVVSALARETGCQVAVADGAPRVAYPPIDVARIREEFGFEPSAPVTASLSSLVEERRRAGGSDGAAPR